MPLATASIGIYELINPIFLSKFCILRVYKNRISVGERWKYNRRSLFTRASRKVHGGGRGTGTPGGWPLRCAPIEKSAGARIDPSSLSSLYRQRMPATRETFAIVCRTNIRPLLHAPSYLSRATIPPRFVPWFYLPFDGDRNSAPYCLTSRYQRTIFPDSEQIIYRPLHRDEVHARLLDTFASRSPAISRVSRISHSDHSGSIRAC